MSTAVSGQPTKSKDPWSHDRLLDRLMGIGGTSIVFLTVIAVSSWRNFFWGTVSSGFLLCLEMGAFFILEPIARGYLAEQKVRRLLARLNIPAVHDVFVRTPDGRQAQLDHVAFLGQAVAVIETKSITGIVTRAGSRWSHLLNGRERYLPGRSPQQQVLDARDVLRDAYPSWRPTIIALTVLTHGELGDGFRDDAWVITASQLPSTLERFQRARSSASDRGWTDLGRFLRASRQTRRERWKFLRSTQLNPKNYSRQQLVGMGALTATIVLGSMFLMGLLLTDIFVPWTNLVFAKHPEASRPHY